MRGGVPRRARAWAVAGRGGGEPVRRVPPQQLVEEAEPAGRTAGERVGPSARREGGHPPEEAHLPTSAGRRHVTEENSVRGREWKRQGPAGTAPRRGLRRGRSAGATHRAVVLNGTQRTLARAAELRVDRAEHLHVVAARKQRHAAYQLAYTPSHASVAPPLPPPHPQPAKLRPRRTPPTRGRSPGRTAGCRRAALGGGTSA